MNRSDRREFLAEVGQGMVTVLVGSALAADLGLGSPVYAGDDKSAAPGLARLAGILMETPPAKVFPVCKDYLDRGGSLRHLVASAALANARVFAGENYDGYHTFMAMPPAFTMAGELPQKERALPVFKVIYRNARLMHGKKRQLDEHVEGAPLDGRPPDKLLTAVRGSKITEADRLAVTLGKKKPEEAYDEIQPLVHDALNVHRVVLAWRAWEILDFTGKDHAQTMLRQTVRHCAHYDDTRNDKGIRGLLPKLLESHKLLSKKPGTRTADDRWVEKLSRLVYAGKRADAAGAAAEALADGISPDSVGEAISLAATQLVLADRGRLKAWSSPAKPAGSVHGDSVGVHASDAANAWRHIAAVTSARNTFASLIAAAYHTAGQTGNQMPSPYPHETDLEKVSSTKPITLLAELDEAIQAREQARACAVVARYGKLGHDPKDVLAVLRQYAVSEDGALHAEKYYRTATEEYARGRASFRWRHVVALARVTASTYGTPAPGLEEARTILGV